MNGRSAGGLVLLLVGSLGLIGFLTGNLDRWLGFLFTPPDAGSSGRVLGPAVGHPTSTPAGAGDRRGSVA